MSESKYKGLWSGTTSNTSKAQAALDGSRFLVAAAAEGFTNLKLAVHDNIGWHFNLYSDNVSFYPCDDGRISVLAGGSLPHTGRVEWSTVPREFPSFTEAWRAVLKAADAEIAGLQRKRELLDREKVD